MKDLADGREFQLTHEPPARREDEARIGRPAWSPDSRRVALTIGPPACVPTGPNTLYVLDVRRGETVVVGEDSEYGSPAWKPGS